MSEIFGFLIASGLGQAVLLCVGFSWVLLEVRSLKAFLKESREAAERCAKEFL